jgi:hypothetical protein
MKEDQDNQSVKPLRQNRPTMEAK